MSLPPTAQTRWLTASLVRHLAEALPEAPLYIGPLNSAPSTLPALILQVVETSHTPFLGDLSHAIATEAGALVTVTHALLIVDHPATFAAASGALADRVRVVLSDSVIPWISEEVEGVTLNHGDLALHYTEGAAHPSTKPLRDHAIAQGWSWRTGTVTISGFLHLTRGTPP